MNLNPITVSRTKPISDEKRSGKVLSKTDHDLFGCRGAEQARFAQKVRSQQTPGDRSNLSIAAITNEHPTEAVDAGILVDYILENHHRYIRSVSPSILRYALKVAYNHGGTRPDLIEIGKIFTQITGYLEAGMMKEEQILFPYIKALVKAHRNEGPVPVPPFATMSHLVETLLTVHRHVEEWAKRIRELSNDYTPSANASMSCRILFRELEDFERDLYRLMQLEDYVLFPKALALGS